jgi:opacity protein-like surface antigen
MMKLLTLAAAAAIALGGVAAAPALAQPGHDMHGDTMRHGDNMRHDDNGRHDGDMRHDNDRGHHWNNDNGRHEGWDRGRHNGWDRGRHNGWNNRHSRNCRWVWRHHHRERVCGWR